MSPAEFIDNPDWFRFLPDLKDGVRCHIVPAHEDCEGLDLETCAAHLMKGGTLGRMDGYEERPGQLAMLKAVAGAFNEREHLMVEAGTGVGKSLAYLLPAVQWAERNDTTVVVSTVTRNLQSQLLNHDIPRALETLRDKSRFKVAILKGRANYACLRAIGDFFASGYWTMDKEEQAELPHFIEWLETTPDGDLDQYEGYDRSLLGCPGEDCSGRRCPYYRKCFVYRARERAAEAHLLVVNHALVMSDTLPPYGRIVLDEAHNLEQVATEYFSTEFSVPELTRILSRLVRTGKGRHARQSGVLAKVDYFVNSGRLPPDCDAASLMELADGCKQLCGRLVYEAEGLAEIFALLLRPVKGEGILRHRVKHGRRGFSVKGVFKDYEAGEWDEAAMLKAYDRFEQSWAALQLKLSGMAEMLGPESELFAQLSGVSASLRDFMTSTWAAIKADKDTHVYWVERIPAEKKRPAYVRLVRAPLDVGPQLAELLYRARDSVVLCSATLRVGTDFKYMARRLGCDERFRMVHAQSPFDYFRQCLTMAGDFLPDPSIKPREYASALGRFLLSLARTTEGRMLVLFTSYEMMFLLASLVRDDFDGAGISLLVQGEGLSREAMTRRLKEAQRPTVLFGARSFWEGVDVAGPALSCVVLTRLPFAQVGDPIVEARAERIDLAGGSSFREYLLPEAVIQFRQGFGRLVRTREDRGVVVITDPRIATKSYGAVFKRSIPATLHIEADAAGLLSRTSDFLA